MPLRSQEHARTLARATGFAGLLAFSALPPAFAQQTPTLAGAPVSVAQMRSWHEDLKTYAPVQAGCFHASYPSLQWQPVACGPKPAFVSAGRPKGERTDTAMRAQAASGTGPQIVGNGNDYVALTSALTTAAYGTFPTMTGVRTESSQGVAAFGGGGLLGANEYSLQLNSDITSSAEACSAFGYSSCDVWEQFVYSTAYSKSYPSEIFIQNWVFPSESAYEASGCPSGWNDASSQDSPACYKNSAAVTVPNAAPTSLASLEVSASVSGGKDTLVFTEGTEAYSTSEPDSTVYLSSFWKHSEFNVVGNAGGSRATFNKPVSVTVNLVVKDGATTAPTCVSDDGTTGETNNLTAGACKTVSGASPAISFVESN